VSVAAPTRSGLTLLAALFVVALALRPQLVGVGPVLPDVEADLRVSHAVAGLLATIPVLCMGLFAPAAGRLAGRLGVRGAIAACVAAVAVFGLIRVALPGIALVLLFTVPVGVGMALAGALLPVAVKARFPHRPAFASGVSTTGLSIGAAISSALAVPAAEAFGGWRGALAAMSVVTVVLGAAWLVLSRGEWTERAVERAPRLPVRRPIVWVIVAVFGLQSVVFYGVVAWLPDAFQERGWSPGTAGALVAVFGLAALPGGLGIPWLADRAGSRRLWLASSSVLLAVATFGVAAIPGLGFAWAALAGVAIGAVFPLCLALCMDVAHEPAAAGAAVALVYLGGYVLASLAPFGLGALRDATGSFTTSLWALFATAVALLACCVPLTAERLRPA
jgi:CP family cyanate transporter-like MFS transporter